MSGQVKSVKPCLKQLQQSIQTIMLPTWPSDEGIVSLILKNFCVLYLYCVLVMFIIFYYFCSCKWIQCRGHVCLDA